MTQYVKMDEGADIILSILVGWKEQHPDPPIEVLQLIAPILSAQKAHPFCVAWVAYHLADMVTRAIGAQHPEASLATLLLAFHKFTLEHCGEQVLVLEEKPS